MFLQLKLTSLLIITIIAIMICLKLGSLLNIPSQLYDIHVPFFVAKAKTNLDLTEREPEPKTVKIAFVQNTFSESAYDADGFYIKYKSAHNNNKEINVTTGDDMPTTFVRSEASEQYILTLAKHLKNSTIMPKASFNNITDQDIHNDLIFSTTHNTRNVYDILILFREEYVTQKMYDNLRRFVNNGGTIVFMDANPFVAEVNYNKVKNTITLVKGHGWESDGTKSVKQSVPERWFNETKNWVGSNVVNRPVSANIYFLNNPFNYTHFEENYVNNPHVKTLFNYKASFPNENKDYNNDTKIAAYVLNNGRGKVVMLGIYSDEVLNNKIFLDFFDAIILPHALAPTIPTIPSIKITEPVNDATLKEAVNITVQGTASSNSSTIIGKSTNQYKTGIKHVVVLLDNGTYHNAIPYKSNDWSKWSFSFNFTSLGSHKIIARVTDNAGNMNWSSAQFYTDSVDKFGVKKIYQTKPTGREWYVNMDNPHNDKIFILGNIQLERQRDGSWQIGSTNIQDTFNGKYHIIMGVNTPPGQAEWKNVEITGYAKVLSTSDPTNVLQWFARGANHTVNAPCEGTSLKGRILINGSLGWKKEIWHDGGYTDQNATSQATHSILNRWIGWKVVMYNMNNDTAVTMESYLDEQNTNKWKKVTYFIDKGGWYASSTDDVFYNVDCGKPKDYIVTNSGPIASFRSDGIVWDFKNLSVREIEPPRSP
jgi:hypothetical protein